MILGVIRFYQQGISPYTRPACRFSPTCSAYAAEAVQRHGAARGSWLGLKRILRCRPFGGWGHDPVPEVLETTRPEVFETTRMNRRGSEG